MSVPKEEKRLDRMRDFDKETSSRHCRYIQSFKWVKN
jgi:hypothetical protein